MLTDSCEVLSGRISDDFVYQRPIYKIDDGPGRKYFYRYFSSSEWTRIMSELSDIWGKRAEESSIKTSKLKTYHLK